MEDIKGLDYLTMADLMRDRRQRRPPVADAAKDPGSSVFAKDIMTTDVVTVSPDTTVGDIAALLIERRISAVPVVDPDGAMLGIVSEGDLVHRIEGDYRVPRPWWLAIFGDREDNPHEYVKSHGSRASDVMTRKVIAVSEYTYMHEIARILESHRIKRVPVVRDGKLVGIVSRADVIRALVKSEAAHIRPPTPSDREIRAQLLKELRGHPWAEASTVNVVVADGVVRLFGFVESEDAREALRIAAENVPGVVAVDDKLAVNPMLLTEL